MKSHISEYHTPGCSKFVKRAKNGVFYNAGSSTQHELAKAVGALMLLKCGDIKITPEIKKGLIFLSFAIDNMILKFPKQKANFITEAVHNGESNRRVDLVNVNDNTRFEFETNHKIKKEGATTIYV